MMLEPLGQLQLSRNQLSSKRYKTMDLVILLFRICPKEIGRNLVRLLYNDLIAGHDAYLNGIKWKLCLTTENIFEEVLLIRERFRTGNGNRHTFVITYGILITDQVFARSMMGVCLRRNMMQEKSTC